MNTREKIRTLEELRPSLARDAWTVVTGRFDPLTAHVAEELQSLTSGGRKLLVVIQHHEDELLSADARAVLLAALRPVDAVLVEDSNDWREVAGRNSKAKLVEDAVADEARTQNFKALVLSRDTRGA